MVRWCWGWRGECLRGAGQETGRRGARAQHEGERGGDAAHGEREREGEREAAPQAHQDSDALLVSSIAAPLARKMQLGTSIARSWPGYQLEVMFSCATTRTYASGLICRILRARSTDTSDAEQPMPPRL